MAERRLTTLLAATDFLNSVSTGLLMFDAQGEVVDCNAAAMRMLAVTYEELSSPQWYHSGSQSVHEDGTHFPVTEQPAMLTLRSGEPQFDVVIGMTIPGDSRRWFSVNTEALTTNGTVDGVISSFVDVTSHHYERLVLRQVTEVNRVMRKAIDQHEFLNLICRTLVEFGDHALAKVDVTSGDELNVFGTHAAGETDFLYDGMFSTSESEAIGLGPVGTAMRSGLTQVANDLVTQSNFEPWRSRALSFGLHSLVSIPFNLDQHRAVMTFYDRHILAFDKTVVGGLEEVVRETEFGAAHVRAVDQLATALDGTISALAQMTETRDPYTAGHQMHVGTLGERIAMQLGLEAHLITLIRQSGELHDVGKIAVPAEILTRPGRLSDLEFTMVKTHTTVGGDILTKASLPWPIAQVALQHHERLNGSGYPFSLHNHDIILPARIIAVADVVEAITHHRPYRPALGIEAALAEITVGSGTLYDADVVSACLQVFEAGFTFNVGLGSIED
jgi:HD-GYP domain-containing protein (c-di-GMP phosphodiesterase class II)